LFLTSQQKERLADQLARIPARELTGEIMEKILAAVFPDAHQLPKDKKWFDIVQPTRALEVKTFVAPPPLQVGSTVYNVLKRVSKVRTKDSAGRLRDTKEVGNEVIDYLHTSIREHANRKRVPENHILSVLLRTSDARSFVYWEEPLYFGRREDYRWIWNPNETLTGCRGDEIIFQWYSRNQKQLFYRWKVPPNADFFQVQPVRTVTLTEHEYEAERRKAYQEGYDDAKAGKPKRL